MNSKKVSTLSKRLTELMHIKKLRQVDICIDTSICKTSMSLYVNGKRNMRQNTIDKIAQTYNINPVWLMGYDVPMTTPDLKPYFMQLSDFVERMDDKQRTHLLVYAEFLVSKS